ncbi:hypothetical protein QJS66_08415 [Kocuria rhizophila]|nr:hypothetical protein QJS66_08415 [Kocuria rhizophila]
MNAVLRRLDHSNIALIIAGPTPLAVSSCRAARPPRCSPCNPGSIGALLVLFRVFWVVRPWWLYTRSSWPRVHRPAVPARVFAVMPAS